MFGYLLKLKAVNWAMKKPAPNIIRTSSPGCLENNFYAVSLLFDDKEFVVEKVLKGVGYLGCLRDGEKWFDFCVSKELLKNKGVRVNIIHYFKRYNREMYSATAFYLGKVFFVHRVEQVKEFLLQFLFNRKRLVRKERMELLKYFAENTIKNPNYSVSSLSVGIGIYSSRWFYHPGRKEVQSHISLILESLVDSGELKRMSNSYKITPKALATLAEFERDEEKHKDIVSNGRLMVFLTAALVMYTVGSSEIFSEVYGCVSSMFSVL